MSYDPVKAGEKGDYYAEEQVYKKTWNLGIISTVGIIVALANFSICIWIRFDLDFWEWIEEIQWYTYWNAMYVVMVAMLLHALNASLTLFATFQESRGLLTLSAIFRFIIWWVTLAGAIVICLYGVEESDMLVKELDGVFMGLIDRWDYDERASRVMTMIQEYVGCCGASGNRDDYINWHKPVPFSCRHPVTGNCYTTGFSCPQALAWWLEPWSCTLAGSSVFFCLLDVVIFGITKQLHSALGEY